jgi:hypothetical protein
VVSERTHVVPRNVRESTCWLGQSATMDEIEVAATVLPHGPAGAWARSVVSRAAERALPLVAAAETGEICQGYGNYEEGVIETLEHAMSDSSRRAIILDQDAAASVRRMLDSGVDQVVVRPYAPAAFIRPAYEDSPVVAGAALPEGAVEVAIVDELDKTAVIDLLAVAPGPTIYRRHDGDWHQDDGWVLALKSVKPPPMVKLAGDQALMASVEQQVDEVTAGTPFTPLNKPTGDDPEAQAVTSSAYVNSIIRQSDDFQVQLALTAAIDVGEMKNPVGTERLRQYWLRGKGAAKIRWGTPGAWSRCRRLLSKYMPPTMVPGYCTNLSQRLGGQGVATHVGRGVRGSGSFNPNQKRRADGEWTDEDHGREDGRSTASSRNKGRADKTGRRTATSKTGRVTATSKKPAAKKSMKEILQDIADMMAADPEAKKFFEAARKMSPAEQKALQKIKSDDDKKAARQIAEDIQRDPSLKEVYERLSKLSNAEQAALRKLKGMRPSRPGRAEKPQAAKGRADKR